MPGNEGVATVGQELVTAEQLAVSNASAAPEQADSQAKSCAVPRTRRSRLTNKPSRMFSTNTSTGRRAADLARGYADALNNPDNPATLALIAAAAQLTAIAEVARREAMRDPVHADLSALVKIEGVAARAVRKLGIKPAARKPSTPTLAEQVAAAQRAREAAEAEQP
jgi:hypothetical protein